MLGWLKGRGRDARREIAPQLWQEATAPWLFMRGMSAEERARLHGLCERFLAIKHYSGVRGIELTERMQVEIAAQACILVLELGIGWYEGWSEIVVYPAQFAPEREIVDEAGVVHLVNDPMAGEAWLGGPLLLSYEDVALAADESERVPGYNVVIHEFAHKLDMRSGDANGFPPLHDDMDVRAWKRAFSAAYDDFCAKVERADRMPERRAEAAYDALPMDPYASESPSEFFAVGSEAFFETPERLAPAYPAVYEQLRLFYRQDPLARLRASA